MTRIILLIFVWTSWLSSYQHTPMGMTAQLGYSCGYTAGIYRIADPSHKEGKVCADMRHQYQIDSDGSK